MNIRLSDREARVIGCLIEKEITTPDQYPLSLNALVNACNQKNNRDPVMTLRESDVHAVLEDLGRRHLVASEAGFGSRVTKFRHRFCNTEFGSLRFSPQETAVICELLLRDGQMPGELRSRATRMAPFADVQAMERVLDALAAREDGPFVAKLPREPGRRESRYVHLFAEEAAHAAASAGVSPSVHPAVSATASDAAQASHASHASDASDASDASNASDGFEASDADAGAVLRREIGALRAEVAALRAEVAALRARADASTRAPSADAP